jgi:hypothetical protein
MKKSTLIAALMGILAAGFIATANAGEDGLTPEEARVYLICQKEVESEPNPDQREKMFDECVHLLSEDL